MENVDTPFFAAIPHSLMDDLADRKITPSMLVVMCLLYRWASFRTGKVKHTSAKAIAEAAGMHCRTAQDSLLRLNKQGYIQRHLRLGSHHWYPVTINNFLANVPHPVLGADGKPERDPETGRKRVVRTQKMINPSETFSWDEVKDGSPCGSRAEDVEEPVYEDVDERLYEGIQNTTKSEQEEQERAEASQQLPRPPAGGSGGGQASNPKPKDSDLEFANRIARQLEPDKKYLGDSVQKLLSFLSHADESARTCISDAVSDPLVLLKLNQATDSKMGYLIDSVKEGYVTQWLEKAEKARDKRRKQSPPVPAVPPENDDAPPAPFARANASWTTATAGRTARRAGAGDMPGEKSRSSRT